MAIALNGELREVVSRCLCQSANAAHFLSTEEHEYKRGQCVNLQQILAKTRSLAYRSVQEFQHDIQQVVLSAQQTGQAGDSQLQIAQWAQELQEVCQAELEARPSLVPPTGDSGTAGSGNCSNRACQDATSLAGQADGPSTVPSSMDLDSPADQLADAAADHHLQPSATCSECLPSSDTEDHANELSHNPGAMNGGLGIGRVAREQPQDNGRTNVAAGLEGLGSFEHISCHYSATMHVEHAHTAGSAAPMVAATAMVNMDRKPQMMPHGRAAGWSDDDDEFDQEGDPELAGQDAMDYDAVREQVGDGHSQHAQSVPRTVAQLPTAVAEVGPKMSLQGSSALSSLEALVAACELAAEKEGLGQDCQYYQELVAESPVLYSNRHQQAAPASHLVVLPACAPRPTSPQTAKAHAQEQEGPSNAFVAASDARQMHAPQDVVQPAAHANGDPGPKYRRHKSKVFIRPNKVVYLPTTFMEEAFDPSRLPINCCMVVEADGQLVAGETHHVTIKAVPRQGLSTMYCMTNVMKFQQQYLNWQILHWTKMDDHHIKIHLQGPHSASTLALPRTSSVPTPRTAHNTKHNGAAANAVQLPSQLSPASAKAGSSHPSYDPLYDANQTALLRSLSTCMPDYHEPPAFHVRADGNAGGVDGMEDGHHEGTRRSTRAVRMTAVMAEHLQQERLQINNGNNGNNGKLMHGVGRAPGQYAISHMGHATETMPMFLAAPGAGIVSSHKRRSDECTGLHPDNLTNKPQLGMHGSMQTPTGVHGLTGCNSMPGPDLFSALPLHTAPPHATSCPGAFMEGSATANLYYLPQAKRSNSNAAATITTHTLLTPGAFPGPTTQGPGLVSGGNSTAATGAAAGSVMAAPLPSSGPRCIMTPSHAGHGVPVSDPALPSSSPWAQGFVNPAAGITALLGAGSTDGVASCTLPAPKPLNTDMLGVEGPAQRSGSPSVGILGPSIKAGVMTSLITHDITPHSLFGYNAPVPAASVHAAAPRCVAPASFAPFTAATVLVKNRRQSEDGNGSGNNTSSSGIGNGGQPGSCSDTSDSKSGRASGAGAGAGLLELDGAAQSPSARKRSTSSIDADMAAAMQALPLSSGGAEPFVEQRKSGDLSASPGAACKRRRAQLESITRRREQQQPMHCPAVVPDASLLPVGPSADLMAAAAAAAATLKQRASASLAGSAPAVTLPFSNVATPFEQNSMPGSGTANNSMSVVGANNTYSRLHHALGVPAGPQVPLQLSATTQQLPVLPSQASGSIKPAIGVPSGPYHPFMVGSHMSAMQALFALSQLHPLGPPQTQPLQSQPASLMAYPGAGLPTLHGMAGTSACVSVPPGFHTHPVAAPSTNQQQEGPMSKVATLGYHMQ